MVVKQDNLYKLLPAIYRRRDKEQGEPLRALLAVMEQELLNIEQLIDKTYADCFIETCDLAVVPYIADLLGLDLHDQSVDPRQRRRVANTLRYRRHKGQASTAEQVIRDTTGWQAQLIEYPKRLAITQAITSLRLNQGTTVQIRDKQAIRLLNTPFDRISHSVEIRNPNHVIKHNLNQLGVSLWRLPSYAIQGVNAGQVIVTTQHPETGFIYYYFTFSPVGVDTPLFNKPIQATERETVGEINVPAPIQLRTLQEDLENYLLLGDQPDNSLYYGPERSFNIVKVFADHKEVVTPSQLVVTDLSEWDDIHPTQIAIDPTLGRILFRLSDTAPQPIGLEVDYHYGFSGDLGGGGYHRQTANPDDTDTTQLIKVAKDTAVGEYTSLQAALTAWDSSSKPNCIIQIMDNATYTETITQGLINNQSLIIQAADGVRPCIISNLTITNSTTKKVQLTLNGLLITGYLQIPNNLELNIQHCTLLPQISFDSIRYGGTITAYYDPQLITIDKSIIGAMDLPANVYSLTIRDSIIDAKNQTAIDNGGKPGPELQLERVTVFGSIKTLLARLISNSIITQSLTATHLYEGCLRYSYLPMDSSTPHRYRCQPELAFNELAQKRADELELTNIEALPQIELDIILNQLLPRFTSTVYGHWGYAQLSQTCPTTVRMGSETSTEMGVFNDLNQAYQENQLHRILEEYLPYTSEPVAIGFYT